MAPHVHASRIRNWEDYQAPPEDPTDEWVFGTIQKAIHGHRVRNVVEVTLGRKVVTNPMIRKLENELSGEKNTRFYRNTKYLSAAVFYVSVISLFITRFVGFNIINPFVAIILVVASIVFFLMGTRAEGEYFTRHEA